MQSTCSNVEHMKMIQIRNVPDEVHRTLKVRAAQAGMSLSDYLLRELTKISGRPTWEEWREGIKARGPLVGDDFDSAAAIRDIRGPI